MKLCSLLLAITFVAVGCSSSDNSTIVDGPDTTTDSGLLDTVWEIEKYTNSTGQLVEVATETKYQFLFESGANSMQAFIGCVNFAESTYLVNDGFVNFILGSSDGVVCINQAELFLDQNKAILSLIFSGETTGSATLMYVASDARLELEAADGRKLELIAVSELMQQE